MKCHVVALFRGKGDYFRLGHGTDVHVRKPQMVEGLRGKKIVHVAVGALHCLAVTDTGQVGYGFFLLHLPVYFACFLFWHIKQFMMQHNSPVVDEKLFTLVLV